MGMISRQAAIEAINELHELPNARLDLAVDTLEKLPSAQPDIIRCRDCAKRKYCRTSTVWAVAPDDDWFCADAERRTE